MWRHLKTLLDTFCTIEKTQVEDKTKSCQTRTCGHNQLTSGGGRSARGQHIIMNQHPPPRLNRVNMHLHSAGPVFECILLAPGLVREFASFTHGNKRTIHRLGQQHTKDKPPCLDTNHSIHPFASKGLHEMTDDISDEL